VREMSVFPRFGETAFVAPHGLLPRGSPERASPSRRAPTCGVRQTLFEHVQTRRGLVVLTRLRTTGESAA